MTRGQRLMEMGLILGLNASGADPRSAWLRAGWWWWGVRPATLGFLGTVSPRGPGGSPSLDECVRECKPLPLRKRNSHSPGREAREEAGWPFLAIELRLFPELQAVWSQWNLHINRGTRPLKEGRKGLTRSLVYRLPGYSEHNKKLQISFPTSQRSAWFVQDFYCPLLKYYPGSELQSHRSSPIWRGRCPKPMLPAHSSYDWNPGV